MTAGSLRRLTLSALRSGGLFSLSANSYARNRRLLVLCYHGIALRDEDRWLGHLYITAERFRRRLELLRSFSASVIPLSEGFARLREGSLPARSVVITFDDGFADFHTHAMPLLRTFGYPATLYLTTHYCVYRLPIFNLALNYTMWKSGRPSLTVPEFGIPEEAPISVPSARLSCALRLIQWAESRSLSTKDKDGMARSLADKLNVDYDDIVSSRILQLMRPDEVAEVSSSGIDVELHTHRHRTPRTREMFLREIRDNAALIREFTRREPQHFCYPSGDYDARFLPWLRECGVVTATTCERGLAAANTEPLLLPRMLDDSIASEVDFERWLAGFWL